MKAILQAKGEIQTSRRVRSGVKGVCWTCDAEYTFVSWGVR